MIPVSTFNIMLVFDMALIFYAFIDSRNPLYTDIIAAVAAGILSTYLGVAVRGDIVHEGYGTAATLVNSESLGLVFIFAGVCMFAFALYKVAGTVNDALLEKKQREYDQAASQEEEEY